MYLNVFLGAHGEYIGLVEKFQASKAVYIFKGKAIRDVKTLRGENFIIGTEQSLKNLIEDFKLTEVN